MIAWKDLPHGRFCKVGIHFFQVTVNSTEKIMEEGDGRRGGGRAAAGGGGRPERLGGPAKAVGGLSAPARGG